MKPSVRILTIAAIVLGTAATVAAAPRSTALTTPGDADQFSQLKAGDSVHLVCNECMPVNEQKSDSAGQAMVYCKEGSKVTCPSCHREPKIVMRGRPAARTLRREVYYVNDKGMECFFIAAKVAGR